MGTAADKEMLLGVLEKARDDPVGRGCMHVIDCTIECIVEPRVRGECKGSASGAAFPPGLAVASGSNQ